jgi:hypothetical protein
LNSPPYKNWEKTVRCQQIFILQWKTHFSQFSFVALPTFYMCSLKIPSQIIK